MYPTHVTTDEAIEVFEQMGFHYPPNDWSQVRNEYPRNGMHKLEKTYRPFVPTVVIITAWLQFLNSVFLKICVLPI